MLDVFDINIALHLKAYELIFVNIGVMVDRTKFNSLKPD